MLRGMSTSSALFGLGVTAAMGLLAWFLTIPMGASFVEMVAAKKPEEGSRRYRMLRIQRWLSAAFCAAMFFLILAHWIQS